MGEESRSQGGQSTRETISGDPLEYAFDRLLALSEFPNLIDDLPPIAIGMAEQAREAVYAIEAWWRSHE